YVLNDCGYFVICQWHGCHASLEVTLEVMQRRVASHAPTRDSINEAAVARRTTLLGAEHGGKSKTVPAWGPRIIYCSPPGSLVGKMSWTLECGGGVTGTA